MSPHPTPTHLRSRPDSDAHGQLHAVLVRDCDGRHVLRSVADDGDEDHADEDLWGRVGVCVVWCMCGWKGGGGAVVWCCHTNHTSTQTHAHD